MCRRSRSSWPLVVSRRSAGSLDFCSSCSDGMPAQHAHSCTTAPAWGREEWWSRPQEQQVRGSGRRRGARLRRQRASHREPTWPRSERRRCARRRRPAAAKGREGNGVGRQPALACAARSRRGAPQLGTGSSPRRAGAPSARAPSTSPARTRCGSSRPLWARPIRRRGRCASASAPSSRRSASPPGCPRPAQAPASAAASPC